MCRDVINLFALPAGAVAGAARLDLRRIPGLLRILATPDGRRHLLVRKDGRSVQICLSGSLSDTVHLLADAVMGADRVSLGLKAIEDFNYVLTGKALPSRASAGRSDRRLQQILRAVDGRRAGASYRDIAIVLFGAQRVAKDWNDDGDHLKNHVRRLVRRGEALVDGGYRRLLQRRF